MRAVVCASIAAIALALAAPTSARAGTIRGTVLFEGAPPARAKLKRDTDPVCARIDKLAEDVVVTDGKLRDVHVHVKNGSVPAAPAPAEPVVVSQRECMYTPRVVGVIAGQKLVVRNGDPTYHNVRGILGKRTLFNLSQPPAAPELVRENVGKAGEIVELHCDVHPWMVSYAYVTDHPYFAVSGEDGTFKIEGVPPGTYEVEAWHPTLGVRMAKVTVGGAETKKKGKGKGAEEAVVSFTFGK